MTTAIPSRPSPRAVSRPIPLFAPVMNATLSFDAMTLLLLWKDLDHNGRSWNFTVPVDRQILPVYTDNMKGVKGGGGAERKMIPTPCLCTARPTSRAVTKIYDSELRKTGLRVTQHSLLRLLGRSGEVRQGDLGDMASLDEPTLTRSLRLLQKSGWVTIRAGSDRREKLVAITEAGKEKVERARPAWSKARNGCAELCPTGRGTHSSRHCRKSCVQRPKPPEVTRHEHLTPYY